MIEGRREFLLQGSAVMGATLAAGVRASDAPTEVGVAVSGGIDVHAHFLPDFYIEALASAGHSLPDGLLHMPAWSAEEAVKLMDELGVRTSMLSISSPGVHFGDDAKARALSRRLNEYATKLRDSSAGRFGHLASVPLPNVGHAIEEAVYALETLRADG